MTGTGILREERIGGQRLILGDCLQVMPGLGRFDAVVTDPPYGILSPANSNKGSGGGKLKDRTLNRSSADWDVAPSVETIAQIVSLGRDCIIWGGNYFALPPCRGLLIWDKMQPWSNFSAAEIAWTTLNRPAAMFRQSSSLADKGQRNPHPTVKPLALMEWCLGFVPAASTILDPFMGSGTTLVACQRLGRQGTGIELDHEYFEIACRRVDEAARQPDLLIPETRAPAPVQEGFDL